LTAVKNHRRRRSALADPGWVHAVEDVRVVEFDGVPGGQGDGGGTVGEAAQVGGDDGLAG
jgi:hypothetical protein